MPYKLSPIDTEMETFTFGAFSFPVLLDACGYLFACIHDGPRWFANFGLDPRLEGKHPDGSGDPYPTILGGGFDVTEEEAKIMAIMANNLVAIQRKLPEENRGIGMRSRERFDRNDLVKILADAMGGGTRKEPWPEKIRDDFTEKIERFAKWAPLSKGFHIDFSLSVREERAES